jgi:hypothetical protein
MPAEVGPATGTPLAMMWSISARSPWLRVRSKAPTLSARRAGVRLVGQHADAVRGAVRQQVSFDVPAERVVGRLHCLHRQHRRELLDLRGAVVGHPDMPDQALAD